jgi:serine/threonine protein kinase
MFEINDLLDKINPSVDVIHGGATHTSDFKLINQSTYGCIFHPGINCQGKKESSKYITKIQKNAKTIDNEIVISKILMSIRGYTRFFAPIVKHCPVKIYKQHQDEMAKCKLFEDLDKSELEKQDYISNKIRYVGKTNLNDHILNQTTGLTAWKEIFETHAYLLKGVNKLIDKQIVHYDIKYNNVMFDAELQKPVFIDFGISLHIPSLNQSNYRDAFYTFDTYPYWSFDVCICNFIFRKITFENAIHTKITEADFELIYNVFVYGADEDNEERKIHNEIFNNSIFPFSSSQLIHDYKKTVFKYYSTFFGHTWFSLYTHMMNSKFWHTWDTYSLAVVYLFILDDYAGERPVVFDIMTTQTHATYTSYIELLYSIIFAPPDKRPNPDQTIKSIKSIIKKIQS